MSQTARRQRQYVKEVIARISGYQPAVTGGICDGCMCPFQAGERVEVLLHRDQSGRWHLQRTHCSDCSVEETSTLATNAVATAEIMSQLPGNSNAWTLGNPQVQLLAVDGEEIPADVIEDANPIIARSR